MPISTDSALPENRVKISEDLRNLEVPANEQVLGCVGDAWVRRVWFDMPRYCDGTDLSGYTLSVNYRNTDDDEDRYPVNDAVVNADTITFSWLVGAVACAAPGLTSVSIKAQKLNGDTVEHEFNSTIYYFKVLPANTTGAEPLQEYSDAFTTLMLQWQAEVDEAVAEAPKGKLVGTASGTTPQTVNDAWPTTPESATLYGKSVQNGTPTPENPVEVQVVGGRNLYNPATRENGKWINDQGVINIAANTFYSDKIPVIVGESYTFAITSIGDAFKRAVAYKSDDTFNGLLAKLNPFAGVRQSGTFTIPANTAYIRISGNANDIDAQVEQGTQATPYLPYGSIGLQIGDTVTPIDLQGHTLAGLPDGTRDVLRVDSAGRVWIESEIDTYTITGNETVSSFTALANVARGYLRITSDKPHANPGRIGGGYCSKAPYIFAFNESATHVYVNPWGYGKDIFLFAPAENAEELLTAYSGATLVFRRETPQTIELGTIEMPELTNPCELAIYASLDPQWAIQYEQDPNIVVTALQSSIAPVEGGTASTNYSVNSYLIHANQLYRVTSAIATGETIAPGSNCVACTVMGEVIRLTA